MSRLFTLLFTIFSIAVFAQPNVYLRFDHKMGMENLEFNQTYTEVEQDYDFSITRLQYYISEITITHDGGQTTPLAETWLLVNAGEQMDFNLGKLDITNVEGINFYVGVDPEHNHLDPTTYASGHPLAPQSPSMHWGWASGYRFVCLEGKTGTNLLFTYEIHALGDNNYFQVSVPTASIWEGDDLVIILNADYMEMYSGIDVSGGLIEHGESGDAQALLENFSENVMSQILFTSTPEVESADLFSMYPNPGYNGTTTINFAIPEQEVYRLVVADITGRIISQQYVSGNTPVELNISEKGLYLVQLLDNGIPVHVEKLIIAQ